MRYATILHLLSSLAAIAQAGVAPLSDDIVERIAGVESPVVEERAAAACKSNGCKCEKVKQGQYCGWCDAVYYFGNGGTIQHIYECNSKGGCCDYGYAAKCKSEPDALKHCGK